MRLLSSAIGGARAAIVSRRRMAALWQSYRSVVPCALLRVDATESRRRARARSGGGDGEVPGRGRDDASAFQGGMEEHAVAAGWERRARNEDGEDSMQGPVGHD